MAKNFNLGKTLGSPTPSFSVDNIEEMTRMVHEKKEIVTVVPITEKTKVEIAKPVTEKISPKKEKESPKNVTEIVAKVIEPLQEPAKRGRKPSPPASNERMIRVSVDLPESVFIKLKTKVIMDRTDMKTFVWRLVEDTLK